jgi:hypothetical protein
MLNSSVLYFQYGIALARAETDDVEAKRVLRNTFRCTFPNQIEAELRSLETTIYLGRVLRRLGESEEAEKWYVLLTAVRIISSKIIAANDER